MKENEPFIAWNVLCSWNVDFCCSGDILYQRGYWEIPVAAPKEPKIQI